MRKEHSGAFTAGASLYARKSGTCFWVGPSSPKNGQIPGDNGWFYSRAACLEAAHFFAKLAKELKAETKKSVRPEQEIPF